MDLGTLDVDLSDHLVCYSIFTWSKCPSPSYLRSLKTIDSTAFLSDLQCAPWSVMDMFDDPSDKNEVFNSLFKDILDHHAPLKKLPNGPTCITWCKRRPIHRLSGLQSSRQCIIVQLLIHHHLHPLMSFQQPMS